MRGLGAVCVLMLLAALAGCSNVTAVPDAPLLWWAQQGSASVTLHFVRPLRTGSAPIAFYLARCEAGDTVTTAIGTGSPLVVTGLANNTAYVCSLQASSAVGSSVASRSAQVMPQPSPADSLAAGYRQMQWAPGVKVLFVNDCSLVVFTDGRPDHATAAQYLQPAAADAAQAVVARTPMSGMKLAFEPHDATRRTRDGPLVFDICPVRAAHTTATREGMVGLMSSGALLFAAGEIPGHRAAAPADNVSVRSATGTVSFLDACNGHPTPRDAGGAYHYHGLSSCVTSRIEPDSGPSHLIGIALDGYPIYGDRDIHGVQVPLERLDACNGITSPTPEFPNGVYHYVLPQGATDTYASLRCHAGTVSPRQLAVARSSGFCYVAGNAGMPTATHADERRRP